MRICKTAIAVFFLLSFCLTAPLAFADDSCGPNLTWSLSHEGVLTITGTGDMSDCSYNSAPWKDVRDNIKSVVVEEGVVSIADSAFYWCRSLETVQLPESLESIGESAFQNCNNLLSVNIPRNITELKKWVFYGCVNLPSIKLPEGLKRIEELAFCDCKCLTEIVIPAMVSFISDDRVFSGCNRLSKITIEEGNYNFVSIDGILFNIDQSILLCYPAGKSQASYSVPETVTNINKYAFYWNESIQSITVPASVVQIGEDAFAGCSKMTSIEFAEGVQSIGSTAFHQCNSLSNITFPASLVSLGDDMFESCYKLTSINVADGSSTYKSIDGVLFSSDGTVLVAYPNGNASVSYIVPDEVTTIGDYSFLYNQNIASIVFPEGLTTIGTSAFSGCDKITKLDFPSTLTTIDYHAFSNCEGLTSIVLPKSVLILGDGAFSWCDNLVSVTVENDATSFNKWGVFDYGNDGLTIYGTEGSTAEAHAKEEGFKFVVKTFEDEKTTDELSNDKWTCPECGSEMSSGKFCSECGAARPTNQVCSNCGYEAEDGKTFKFCPECGTQFE